MECNAFACKLVRARWRRHACMPAAPCRECEGNCILCARRLWGCADSRPGQSSFFLPCVQRDGRQRNERASSASVGTEAPAAFLFLNFCAKGTGRGVAATARFCVCSFTTASGLSGGKVRAGSFRAAMRGGRSVFDIAFDRYVRSIPLIRHKSTGLWVFAGGRLFLRSPAALSMRLVPFLCLYVLSSESICKTDVSFGGGSCWDAWAVPALLMCVVSYLCSNGDCMMRRKSKKMVLYLCFRHARHLRMPERRTLHMNRTPSQRK